MNAQGNGKQPGSAQQEFVTLTIDDQEVKVARGTNLIEAAKQVNVEVPFYCYHPHLSVPGNCRICQVEVEGAPKLMIGCHTQAQDGMVVRTHKTSQKVKDTQASTMELLLINHPLDCTVCDQSGHCKLQDYHYEYNAKPSRFLEEKEHKVKAQPLGSTVMLDGERCIACTRCVRFCDEITETGELGLLNRGDKVVIAVKEGHELENPLSGTVVDLCPVGALTHKKWRFNSRIWYSKQIDSVCPGCSTGCNVKVAVRDGQVVQVKARLNAEVNKEWLCDEGRYGFHRFLPEQRLTGAKVNGKEVSLEDGVSAASAVKEGKTLVVVAPNLLLEEYLLLRRVLEKLGEHEVVLAYKERKLSELEAILVSPDYAANYRGAEFMGISSDSSGQSYASLASKLSSDFENALFVGDLAIAWDDQNDDSLKGAILNLSESVALVSDAQGLLASTAGVVLPSRSILEKSGMMMNRDLRLQFSAQLLDFPDGSHPEWRLLNMISQKIGQAVVECSADRDLTRWMLKEDSRFEGITIRDVKKGLGIAMTDRGRSDSSSSDAMTSQV